MHLLLVNTSITSGQTQPTLFCNNFYLNQLHLFLSNRRNDEQETIHPEVAMLNHFVKKN